MGVIMDYNDADYIDNLIDDCMLADEQYYASYWIDSWDGSESFEDYYWSMTGIILMEDYDDRT